jgi:hypothetical protein
VAGVEKVNQCHGQHRVCEQELFNQQPAT